MIKEFKEVLSINTKLYFQFQDKQLFRLTELITCDIHLVDFLLKDHQKDLRFIDVCY